MAIRELETLLKLRLVDRTNKRVTVTSTGRDIAAQARLVLRDMEAIVEIAEAGRAPLHGKMRMGVIPTIAPFLLPGLLPRLRKAYPELKLYLQEDQTLRIYDQLMAGDLDVILIALPYELRNVTQMALYKDPFYLACRQGTRLFDPESHSVEQLPDESILLLEDGHCLRDQAVAACKIRNINKIGRVSASSLLTLVEMVDADLGVTYLPEMAVNSYLLKHTKVKTWPIKAGSNREIGLAWRNGGTRDKEFNELGRFIIKHR